jgi:hypothetical protein
MSKPRALHRYRYQKFRGKEIPMKEIQRRITQSLTACGHFRIAKPQPVEQENNTEIVIS